MSVVPYIPCPNIERCPLFPLFGMQSALNVWKTLYCESGEHENCARLEHVRKNGEKPPDDMLPDGTSLNILRDSKKQN